MEQRIEEMTADDVACIEAQRSWVRDHYESQARSKYDTVDGKLALLDAILINGWIEATETVKLQSLGVTFGDALAQELGLRWVMIEDEYGRDPALKLESTSVLVFPLTSISKRVERGEQVDAYQLFETACATVREAAARYA